MTYAPSKSLSYDEFITKYGDNPHFELADGELIEMEPTGSHQTVGGKLATKISLAITYGASEAIGQTSYPWFINNVVSRKLTIPWFFQPQSQLGVWQLLRES